MRCAESGLKLAARPLSELVADIRAWHRARCFAMEQRKRVDLALGSFLRVQLGWRRDLTKADSDRIKKQAGDLIACGEKIAKGKTHALADTEEFGEWQMFILASVQSRAPWDAIEGEATKNMEALAEALPVWREFGEAIRGFGPRSLAVIVGEAGDLANYANKSKLRKRMCLAVIDGVRQGGLTKGARKEDWIKHGYSAVRRSRMWNIGEALIKSNGPGKYRTLYLARKKIERERAEALGLTVAPAAKIPKARAAEFMSEGHIHRRAQRYMEQRLLTDLWQAWRRAGLPADESPSHHLPVADDSLEPVSEGWRAEADVPLAAERLPSTSAGAPA